MNKIGFLGQNPHFHLNRASGHESSGRRASRLSLREPMDGENYGECTSRTLLAFHANGPTQSVNDCMADRQAQPRAAAALARLVDAIEALENARQVFRRNADARVADYK